MFLVFVDLFITCWRNLVRTNIKNLQQFNKIIKKKIKSMIVVFRFDKKK